VVDAPQLDELPNEDGAVEKRRTAAKRMKTPVRVASTAKGSGRGPPAGGLPGHVTIGAASPAVALEKKIVRVHGQQDEAVGRRLC